MGYLGVGLLAAGTARAQTHVVKAQETVVRAVSVYEWTGELGQATASRVVPVSLYINREYEDAGVYLARPIPMALENGNVFELEKAGVPAGTLEVSYARHLQTPEKPRIDDGWFAYGAVKLKPAAVVLDAKAKPGPISQIAVNGKTGSAPAASGAGTVDRSTAAGSGTTVSAGKVSDPDEKKPDPDSDSAKDDPERPTLRRRTTTQINAADKKARTASVTGNGDLNDDPDRPNLHRGKPATRLDEQDIPPLTGLPADMHQMVAVSDARNRSEHDFSRPWESDAERAEVLAKLREFAGGEVAAYDRKNGLAAGSAPVKTVAPSAPPASAAAAKRRAKAPAAPAIPAPLFDEKAETLHSYTLSYGGAATYVYSASTPAGTQPVRYVTVVAQREPDGTLKKALANVTDANHMDRTPQFRLVDAVDPDASNRASLLFELRGQTERQFALYRVIGAQAEQTIAAGSSEE